ncbi:MAG: outer membrane protein assembly factor BamA [Saprospiraceae bacterium]|nr:outer membrane protein assembly factor BamA [Saprospiraceae bacterium]
MNLKSLLILILFSLLLSNLSAQISVGDKSVFDYSNPKEYEIGGITVSGIKYLDNNVLIMLSGLTVGDKIKIPGEEITSAIKKLWKQGLFENINISATKIQGDYIFLDIHLEERPRLAKFSFEGIKKSEADNIREEINLTRGEVVTENVILRTTSIIKNHFVDKGYLNVEVNIRQEKDTTLLNNIILFININKHSKVKVNAINIAGNENITDQKLKKTLKETKEKKLYRFFKASRYIESDYKDDKIKLLDKYNQLGYRDARIISDSVYKSNNKRVNIDITIEEGSKYYFRNIKWVGNTKYPSDVLSKILGVKRGDVYNQKVLDANLYMNLEGQDVSSLYMDDGYLFFNLTPVEVLVENDSIDLEIRIYEGKQAIVRKVTIKGNTRTNDHVILREIRTKPGQLFNRSDIIRTQRELAQLRYFDQEKLGVNPKPNPADGTVDIEYVVEETSQDQIELSGGWGMGRVVGTLGLSFNNFSMNNFFKKNSWRPLPSGDGQKLSIRAQSNGAYFQSYNASFTEPWLGGKKPNALSVSIYHSVQTNGYPKSDANRQSIKIYGATVGLGKRLQWPDDYFTLYQGVTIQKYDLDNYYSTFAFNNGSSNNLSYSAVLSRNSINQPIFPEFGSEISFSGQITPPYSLLSGKDYSTMSDNDKFKWIEYHKWKFNAAWYIPLIGNKTGKTVRNLVLSTRTKFGFIGSYNDDIGVAPFERFYLGGDGLTGYNIDGRELIGLRGYGNNTLTPRSSVGYVGGAVYNKYTFELRYPISLNPMATVFVMGFAEAGNAWSSFQEFNPFDIKRSAGFGVRIYLPMFGVLGLDWGYGFDEIPGVTNANKGQFHFSINNSID